MKLAKFGNAYECHEKFDKTGKVLERRRSIGGVVVWGIVVLTIVFFGNPLVALHPWVWAMLRQQLWFWLLMSRYLPGGFV